MVNDTWVITSYFNPLGVRTRRENFHHFARSIATREGRLLVVELVDPAGDFELDSDSYTCVRLRGNGLIWQKERLLNLALDHLPRDCRKVIWADGDLIFDSPDWLERSSEALEHDVVIQPFSQAVWLPQGHLGYQGETQEGGGFRESFAACFRRDPLLARHEIYANHGHTGFAWGARRDFLERYGFYDACLTGSGDHLMAHAFAGTLSSPCIVKMIGEDHAYAAHFARWSTQVHEFCRGRLGCVDGTVMHLWHGELGKRRYYARNQEFRTFDFDPDRDIRRDAHGLWEWSGASFELRTWAETYLESRDEDGAKAGPVARA